MSHIATTLITAAGAWMHVDPLVVLQTSADKEEKRGKLTTEDQMFEDFGNK